MSRAALLLAALGVLASVGAALGHEGHIEPGLRTASGQPALVGPLEGLHAPGALVVAPWRPFTIDGHLDEHGAPAQPAPGLAVAFAQNATDLALALDFAGRGWFLVGLDLEEASRALIAMRENIVARHVAVAGWVDDAGNLTFCTGQLGQFYPDPDAPSDAGHASMGFSEGDVLVAWSQAEGGCVPADWLRIDGAASEGHTHIELSVAKQRLGAVPGEVRHALVAFEPARRFLPPKVTDEATRGELNVLLARPGDGEAALGALVRGAPDASAGVALAAVPVGGLLLGAALRRRP